jgi:hypothetical protein
VRLFHRHSSCDGCRRSSPILVSIIGVLVPNVHKVTIRKLRPVFRTVLEPRLRRYGGATYATRRAWPSVRRLRARRIVTDPQSQRRRSGRSRSCGGQHQRVAFDDQPTLGGRVSTGHLEIRHLPIADLGFLGKIIQDNPIADTTTLAIHDDMQQPSANCFGCLISRTFPTVRPRPIFCCATCSPMSPTVVIWVSTDQ